MPLVGAVDSMDDTSDAEDAYAVAVYSVDAASDGPHFAVSFGADQLPAPFRVLVHSAAGAA